MSAQYPITVEQYQEFEGYPGLRDELISGRIIMNPQPKPLHQHVAGNIETLLREASRGTDYTVGGDTNIMFPQFNSMPAPDVFVVAKDAWRRAIENDRYLDSAPLLAVEVLSESNRREEIRRKVKVYLMSGVTTVWIVDLAKQKIVQHALSNDSGFILTIDTDDVVPLPPPLQHPEFKTDLPLASIFALPE